MSLTECKHLLGNRYKKSKRRVPTNVNNGGLGCPVVYAEMLDVVVRFSTRETGRDYGWYKGGRKRYQPSEASSRQEAFAPVMMELL